MCETSQEAGGSEGIASVQEEELEVSQTGQSKALSESGSGPATTEQKENEPEERPEGEVDALQEDNDKEEVKGVKRKREEETAHNTEKKKVNPFINI